VVAQAWFDVVYDANAALDMVDSSHGASAAWSGARYNFYQTRDGKMILMCPIESKFWYRFCRGADRLDLFDENADGGIYDYGIDDTLRHEVQAIIESRDLSEWIKLAIEFDFPLGPAPRDLTEWLNDPHVRDRAMLIEAEHPVIGAFSFVASPIKVRDQPNMIGAAAPSLGEHTPQILAALGVDDTELQRLRAAKVV
jgi:crotonobetainyl-CoA:carnitine CoA-transferase CaiB-like acyl-CoA transferase